MADLSLRNARTTIERAIAQTLQYAVQVRHAAVASVAALRAVASASVPPDAIRYVTAAAYCYQFKRYQTGDDDGNATIKPTDITSGQGRWVKTTSVITSGYAKTVQLYNGEFSIEEVTERLLGQRPAIMVIWKGADHKISSMIPGSLYWYICDAEIWAMSSNLRPAQEVLEGSGIAAELSADPGVISIIGDIKSALAGSALGTTGVDRTEIYKESTVVSDLAQRVFIEKLAIKVFSTVQNPDTDSVTLPDVRAIEIQYRKAETPDGVGEIGTTNYITSGYTMPVGTGLTKTPDYGSAYISTTLVSSSPAAKTFTASKWTYRDLRPDGTYKYTETSANAPAPDVSQGMFRIGVTVTDASDVVWDRILAHSLIDFGGVDKIPSIAWSISTIALTPTTTTISTSATSQLTATATYGNSLTRDVSSLAVWASSAATTATVSAAGLVTGVAAGTANVTAVIGGITSSVCSVTVN